MIDIVLSIIVPFYSTPENDRSQMICDLLGTIPDRTEIEVVVIDDLSEPACRIKPCYQQASFKLERMEQSTLFAGAARNLGLRLATGRYLLCADSDDLFDTDALSLLIDHLAGEPSHGDEVHVHVVEAREFDGTRPDAAKPVLYRHIDGRLYEEDPAAALVKRHAPWAKAFSRAALLKGVTFKENDIVDDKMFSVRLALVSDKAALHDLPVYYVRRNHGAGALTAQPSAAAVRSRVNSYREANAFLAEHDRADLRCAMHHPFRAFIRVRPAVVAIEVCRSILRGERILPYRKRA